MKINSEQLTNYLKRKTVLIFGLSLFFLSSLITITQGGSIIWNFFDESFRYKKVLYNKIEQLATETNIAYFQSLLGNPVYINSGSNIKEYIFVNDLFYVQGITDKNDKVLAYSVTTRDKNFNPNPPFFKEIRIGKSSFKDINRIEWLSGSPSWIISLPGAHDLFYTEGYYLANPGGYQTMFLSTTMAGYVDYDKFEMIPYYQTPNINLTFSDGFGYILPKKNQTPEEKEIDNFRQKNINTINTYTILGPFVALNDFIDIRGEYPSYLFGPEYNQVRLLEYGSLKR